MRKHLCLLFFALISLSFYAQNGDSNIPLDLKMTKVFKDEKKFTNLSFSAKDANEGFFIGRRHKKGYYIEHYDKELILLKSFDFILKSKRSQISQAFFSDGSLCLLESAFNKEEKRIDYSVHRTSSESFSFKKKLLFSVNFDEMKKGGFSFMGIGGGFANYDSDSGGNFKISKNEKYIAFTVDVKDNDSETHRLYVFNNALEKQYQTEFKRGLKDRRFNLENIDIDENDGSIYLLGKSYTREKKKKKAGGKYQFELYKIKGDNIQSLVFDSSENYVGSLTTVINDGKLFCVGFYSERNDNRYKGLVHFGIDAKKMTLSSSTYSPFTQQFILDKYGKEKQKELKNLRFKSIHITETNECILNAEEFFIRSHYSPNQNGGGTTTYTYHYRDIISAKIDNKGKLTWARNINKKQSAGSPSPYLSYTASFYNEKTYFFINCSDNIKRLRNDRIEFRGTKAKKSNFYIITLDDKGDFEYKKVLDDKDSEVPFGVANGILSNNQKDIIFQGRRKGKKQLLKISLKP